MFKNHQICRTCMSTENELLSIYASINHTGEDNYNATNRIIDYFNKCLNIEMTDNDNLPQVICFHCLDSIIEVSKFYDKCVNSEEYYKQKISEVETLKIVTNDNDYSTVIIKNEIENGNENENKDKKCLEDMLKDDDDTEYISETQAEFFDTEESTFQVPVEDTNNVIEKFRCSKCNESFKYEKNCKLHMKIEHNLSPKESVNYIDKKRNSDINEYGEELESDMKNQIIIKPYKCEICGFTFRFKLNFENHKLRHQRNNEKLEASIMCPYSDCGRNFYTEKALQSHVTKLHLEVYNSLLCSICGLELPNNKKYHRHLEKHQNLNKRFKCRFCDKLFAIREHVRCHERTHTNERPFICNICGKSFRQGSTLNTHKTLHTGKTVPCPICDKKFSRKGIMNVHLRKHTQERPYECKQCSIAYTQKCHLQAHMQIHSSEKRYVCEFCGMKFAKKEVLRNHFFRHRPDKKYKCPSCRLETSSSHWFRQHLKRTHNLDVDIKNYKQNMNLNSDIQTHENLELSEILIEDENEIKDEEYLIEEFIIEDISQNNE